MPLLYQIREDQMQALHLYMFKGFETRMLKHIAKVFPDKYETWGHRETRRLIRKGYNKAHRFHLTTERNVSMFIDLMVGLHPEFETDERYRWIREILEDPEIQEDNKMSRIYFFLPYRDTEVAEPQTEAQA